MWHTAIFFIAATYFFLQALAFITFDQKSRAKAFGPASAMSTAMFLGIGGTALGYSVPALLIPLVLALCFVWIGVIAIRHYEKKPIHSDENFITAEEDQAMQDHSASRAH